MAGVLPLSKESPLIRYAIRKLNPEIFSHPIWIEFAKKSGAITPEAIQRLYDQAEKLQHHSPEDACQLFLLCAAYQSSTDDLDNALRTAQQSLALAERNHLSREILWAHWGTCAICFQQNDFDRAAGHLQALQTILTKENEWVLADFVDVIEQSLRQPEVISTWRQTNFSTRDTSNLLDFTYRWFQTWGDSFQNPELDEQPKGDRGHTTNFLHKCALRWNRYTNGARQFSVWQSIRSLLRLQEYERKIDTYTEVKETQGPTKNLPLQITEDASAEITSPKVMATTPIDHASASNSKSVLVNTKENTDHFAGEATSYIPVAVHMLGAFNLMIGEQPVKLPASRGLSVLKYLLLHHKQTTSREMLMDIFWPDAEPATARNNLNVAIHGLRTALRTVIFLPVIIFEDGAYGLEPNLEVWLDVEEFERCVKVGQQLEARDQPTAAVTQYEAAISLYQGDFLEQTPYEEWMVLDRERLRIAYLDSLDRLSQIYFSQERYAACIAVCQLILGRDRCREDAHCLLMRCFSRQGQHHLALRQYQICVAALQTELEVDPAPETTQLYKQIRQHELI